MKSILTLCIATLIGRSLGGTAFQWQTITPVRKVFSLTDIRKQTASIYIDSSKGHLYWLGCHAGQSQYVGPSIDPVHDDGDDYYPDFDCHLHSMTGGQDRNLLSYDVQEGAENFSRGDFDLYELTETCSNYPEWGRVRHVLLRGMKITFAFKEKQLVHKPNLTLPVTFSNFNFEIQVQPDPSAISAIALSPGFEPPPFMNRKGPISSHRCDEIPQTHVAGTITNEYIQRNKLGPPFPQVKAAAKSELISADLPPKQFGFLLGRPYSPADSVFSMEILDIEGNPAYQFECTAYILDNTIMRYGIPCGLYATGEQLDLLADGIDLVTRIGRAQILPEQLLGKCLDYPEWGNGRHFKLRGFELTLKVSEVELAPGIWRKHSIKRLRLSVSIRPDSNSTAPVAEPSAYVNGSAVPNDSTCDQILVRADHSESSPPQADGREGP